MGSANSAAQAPQGVKAARVVWARCHGSAVAMAKRGPQAVQERKGSPWRRLRGASSSLRQAGQGARSAARQRATRPMPSGLASAAGPAVIVRLGGVSCGPRAPPGLGASASAGSQRGSRGSRRAAGGRDSARVPRNRSRLAWRPWSSSRTPAASLLRVPASPSRLARRYTVGRKPTPCTTPRHSRISRARSPAAPFAVAPRSASSPAAAGAISAAAAATPRSRPRCGRIPPAPARLVPRPGCWPGPAPARSPPPQPDPTC